MASFIVLALTASALAIGHQGQVVKINPKNGNATYDVQSSNWAGAVIQAAPGTYQAVTGTFTVPSSSGSGSAAIWVGIDGAGSDCGVILQTGIVANSDNTYYSWYEWFPDPSYNFNNINFAAGDVVKLTATAHSTTTGTVTIENQTNGQSVTQDVSSTHALCQEYAEWIVEDYEVGSGQAQFDDFGTVTFSSAQAQTGSGYAGPDGATIWDIWQNNVQLTQSSVQNGNVVVSHT
ncbi:concanavalin A-like lectin glucanase [Coniophora puteana RWD-64-598 SS2]|uniref:Concanavalin A-like lectin glucanase n=1 Tax=Coniophora puteana (strain RWD-64-598) TaxID=741705 RepID=A0A5M3N7Q1_CONPW|nr:concanavalin A-like lectin glucanase [Coniophora puteana RWD-64-598 SS2]EIW87318.1 concanavalin A-like lectin glucanase [Coniophora puteana RWD-64-598 SS2]